MFWGGVGDDRYTNTHTQTLIYTQIMTQGVGGKSMSKEEDVEVI